MRRPADVVARPGTATLGAIRFTGRVKYAHDGEVALFAARVPRSDRCTAAVEGHCTELFALTAATGYRELFRVRRYVEDVNGVDADGVEVYQDFCVGRAGAFERRGGTSATSAATGVGAHGGGISVHLLAVHEPVRYLENPRIKVYGRRAEDVEEVRGLCPCAFPAAAIAFFAVDLCRPDLLVEIEGTWSPVR